MRQNLDSIPPKTTAPMDHFGDIIFEVDPVTQIRLNTSLSTKHIHDAILLGFTHSMPVDHAPEVLLTNINRTDEPFISEQGLKVISGVVTMD